MRGRPELRMKLRRGGVLVLASFVALSPDTRLLGAISLLAAFLLTLMLSRGPGLSWRRSLLMVMLGVAPAAMTVGALHDLFPATPQVSASRVLIVVLWVLASRTIGATLAGWIQGPDAIRIFLIRTSAIAIATSWYLSGLIRQFLPGADLVTRLSFAILEEDNAHMIGVMREVATLGPRGGELAETYGTGFVVLPDLLIRLLGGPLASELGDPRQAAVTTFAVSSTLVILLLGLMLWTVTTCLSRHPGMLRERALASDTVDLLTTLIGTWIALAVIVVIPMRTSFLTFVWGIALLGVATALALVSPSEPRPIYLLSILTHILAAVWLLLGSWPFVITGIVPVAAVVLVRTWRNVSRLVTRRNALAFAAPMLVALALLAYRWIESGPLAEVLSYGRSLLTMEGSLIRADRYAWMTLLIVLATATPGLIGWVRQRGRRRATHSSSRIALALSPLLALTLTYLGLLLAASLLTDGVLNYAGDKLLYGILAVGLLLGTPAALRITETWLLSQRYLFAVVLAFAVMMSPTIRPEETWWERSRPQRLPQSEAVADVLRRSSPDVPIRCLPPPDLEADRVTRRAAYECVRFVEDAFNDDRRHGHRWTFLETEDATFRAAVNLALADIEPSRDVTQLTMRGGWAGLPPEKVQDLPSPWPSD